ncbi:flagellar hook protein FlgE [Clostridium sp. 'deep sea']|uniref:flagellar hook protein FlgE n=1 Tax=Clostridium sp. 'deep sea' TaxID=2779445 RepID=UPI0018966CFB|nr:flagellar hook protein FlgE [Clostridium sp. 'deep sea']QOR35349.1 flagellar hook protein FlgE [Clostridium sp. 'deep sea']
MLRSMYSGVSGLRAHQTKLDVIGNNIANVNTVAYKTSNITFQEVLSQTLSKAQPPSSGGLGGKNPAQVGLGVSVGSITTKHTPSNLQPTGNPNDLAIDGHGYFVVSDGLQTYYTRAGNFSQDVQGNLVTAGGCKIMGWMADSAGNVNTTGPLQSLDLSSLTMPAKATTAMILEGNIDKDDASFTYDMTVYDSLGVSHKVTYTFTKTAADRTYSYEISSAEAGVTITPAAVPHGTVSFNTSGVLNTHTPHTITIGGLGGAADISTTVNFNATKFTYSSNKNTVGGEQDGYQSGSLLSLGVNAIGEVVGTFSNSRDKTVAALAIASFINPQGLERAGNNNYIKSWNSGEPQYSLAGTGGRGPIRDGALEMSNVDLAKEFTEMIVAQRGFQANSKIITTSDEILQELVNLKR